ncbi:hypothetical protein [Shouchella clausii]|uniref:hypothetical protein n=1 Tax=Shouchella clausii TaxID=79880 RepID=UPI001C72B220|nr:hypothetical protein [Shouchella clausii]MBX0320267.1 hypothetical protein [Shouchella clausii]
MEVKEHFMKEAHAFVKAKHIEEIVSTQKKAGIALSEMEKSLILLGYKHGFSHGVFHGREALLNTMNEQ